MTKKAASQKYVGTIMGVATAMGSLLVLPQLHRPPRVMSPEESLQEQRKAFDRYRERVIEIEEERQKRAL